ncbi:UNVERIFIED_CONTAM: Retrovirus-related Pol polyprotein from transposon RE2 [Sesamum radiatum]|uniref:Retrovirus-related Pol polyprotein from transposon RE2 n=1 Tax=Sesamum radiatum TaxID=300843 RepID=A0AAW2K5S0_SESRA
MVTSRQKPHINPTLHVWKTQYFTLCTMMTKSSFRWDDNANMVTFEDDNAWGIFVKPTTALDHSQESLRVSSVIWTSTGLLWKPFGNYLQDILLDASMTDAKLVSTPFPPGLKLTLDGGSLLPSPDRYRSSLQLSAFSDAAWASCLDSRRFIMGFCIFLGSSIISWKTKKQAAVSRSSAEAEYRSMVSTVSELLWISYLLRDFQLSIQQPIPFWCDNKAALHITANPLFHERTQHLDIDCHLVRDQFKAGFISPTHIAGPHQPADLFTKAVPLPTSHVCYPSWAWVSKRHLEGG